MAMKAKAAFLTSFGFASIDFFPSLSHLVDAFTFQLVFFIS